LKNKIIISAPMILVVKFLPKKRNYKCKNEVIFQIVRNMNKYKQEIYKIHVQNIIYFYYYFFPKISSKREKSIEFIVKKKNFQKVSQNLFEKNGNMCQKKTFVHVGSQKYHKRMFFFNLHTFTCYL